MTTVPQPPSVTLMPAGWLRRLVLTALFGLGLTLRLIGITQPLIDFSPMRQYRAALIARAFYYRTVPDVPDWQRAVAEANLSNQGLLEPPIVEGLSAGLYHLVGGPQLWVPRLLSILFWLAGGIFLYRLARAAFSEDAALFSTAFYLLMPFALVASRTFQPDPLMMMGFLIALDAVWRYHNRPSTSLLLLAAGLASLPMVVKPISVLLLWGAFAGLAFVLRRGPRGVFAPPTLVFVTVSIFPTALYYAISYIVNPLMQGEFAAQIVPRLLLTRVYWAGWAQQVDLVVGLGWMVAALLGVALLRDGSQRGLLVGLWLGYMGMCGTFSFTAYSHSYYHAVLLPIVGLSASPLAGQVLAQVRQIRLTPAWQAVVLVLILVIAGLLGMYRNRWRLMLRIYENADPAIVETAPHIGDIVAHSTRTVFLSEYYGTPLAYHGELAGSYWPTTVELWTRQFRDRIDESPSFMFDGYLESGAEYFIVTSLPELDAQPVLKARLEADYPVLAQGAEYIVYDLRGLGEGND